MNDLSRLRIDRDQQKSTTADSYRRPGRRRVRWLLAALALAAGLGIYGWQRHSRIEVTVGAVTVAYPTQALTLFNATGYVVPQTKADVASKATGRLETLLAEEGDTVAKGQIVARLENRDVQAAMRRADANVAVARAGLAQAQAELKDASLGLERVKTLIARQFVAPETRDTALARHDKAAAGVQSAEASILAAQAALEEARIAVEYTLIRAPFDGVILKKYADIGDVVAPFAATTESKGAVASMADLTTLEVEADVAETNLARIAVGQPCEIQLDALPELRLRGQVHRIVPTVDRSKATVMVKVRFIDRDSRILPDMSAKVAFLSRPVDLVDLQPVTVMPATAVIRRDGGATAFRVDGDRVSRVALTLNGQLGERPIVQSGLNAGDRVVLDPPARLADGEQIVTAAP